jgi:hypothetical protein
MRVVLINGRRPPLFCKPIGKSYLRELGTRLFPIAVIAASEVIENSPCKLLHSVRRVHDWTPGSDRRAARSALNPRLL